MKFTIVVLGAPYSSQSASSALRFSLAVLDAGHDIYRLFFYHDGVYNGDALAVPPQDEEHIPRAWQNLIQKHELDAVVCASSALRRGLLDKSESERYEKPCASLLDGFVISGLGQLVDATAHSDRVVTFPD